MKPADPSAKGWNGFSLVEVAIALGIISFGLVSVVGLLPVGLTSTRQAYQQAQAAQNLNMIAACLQGASQISGTYTALAPFNNAANKALVTWVTKQTAQDGKIILLDESGCPTSDVTQASSLALIQITTVEQGFTPARAHIAVAWPAMGVSATCDGTNFTLTNQQGYLETVVYIHAR